jgi:hypothetical protein
MCLCVKIENIQYCGRERLFNLPQISQINADFYFDNS